MRRTHVLALTSAVVLLLIATAPSAAARQSAAPIKPPTRVGNPNWAPNGEWIAYTGNRYGDAGLYAMHPDGSGQRRIEVPGLRPRWPSWSPDGRRIAFASVPPGEEDSLDLFTAKVDGTDARRVTHGNMYGGLASWSSDSRRLTFYSKKEGRWNVYTVNADGADVRRVTDGQGEYHVPSWFPDGHRILMTATRDATEDIWSIDEITGAVRRVLHTPQGADVARLSPKHDWISFSTKVNGLWQLHLVRPDGSDLRQLTFAETYATTSSWSPDGRRLAYECREGEVQHICVINADGSGRSVITPLVN